MSHIKEKRARRATRLLNAGLMTALSMNLLSAAAPGLARAGTQPAAAADSASRSSSNRALPRLRRPSSSSAAPASSHPGMTALPSARGPILLAAAGPAQDAAAAAQDPTDAAPQLKAVVITGFRQSLQSALEAQRAALQPIEVVAPEDIGKLPDQNIAEALQRLPGVQINRAMGFGTQVLIEGLSQNVIELNGEGFLTGREFYTSGEAANGGAGANFQYNSLESIPSEELSGVDVLLNPTAADLSGALGGTINLKTQDPLALPRGLTLAGNARGVSSEGTSGLTPNATLVADYKFSDRFAVNAAVSYDKERTFTKEFEDYNRGTWFITNTAEVPPASGGTTAANYTTLPQYYIDPQLAYVSNINDSRALTGGTLGLAWRVTDSVVTRLRWFYSNEQDTQINYSDKIWFDGGGNTTPGGSFPGIDPNYPYSIDGNGVVQSGTFVANGAETATLYQGTSSHANNFQWTTAFDNGGPLTGDLGVYYSRAASNLQADQQDIEHGLYETSAGVPTSPGAPGCNNGGNTCGSDPNASPGYLFNYANGGTSGLPSVSYPTNVLYNPAWTTFKSAWAWANLGREDLKSVKVDLHWRPAMLQATTLSGGARWGERNVSEIFGRYLINGNVIGISGSCPTCGSWLYYQDPGYSTPNIPYSTALSAPGLMQTVNNFAAGPMTVKNPYTSGMTDPATFLNTIWNGAGVPNNTERFFEDTLSSYHVGEKTISTYLMADIGSPADHYHINFGVRVVKTDLTIDSAEANPHPTYYGSASWNGVNANNIPIQTLRGYTDVLPTFNYTLDLTPTQQVRFSAARVTAPLELQYIGLGNSYNFTRETGGRVNINTGQKDGFAFIGGSTGNPNLDPYRANQFILGYSDYFARGAVAQVAGFWKSIDSFIITQNISTTLPDDFGLDTAPVSTPENGKGGEIYGAILAAEYPFRGFLDGFGVDVNYTLSKSETDQTTSFTQHLSFPGVSENSFTGVFYYERFGFSGRLSYTWRDKALNDGIGGSTFYFNDAVGVSKTYAVYQAPYGELDAQLGYDFSKHLGIVFSASNLTDEALHTYLQWPNQPFTYDNWGRRFFLGVRFRN
jgi:iron complex outermembrane receptor protein